jgi:hypothetical protein
VSDLHVVGVQLAAIAKAESGDRADAFGRSAFNRYYYAAYLSVRELLRQFDSTWGVKHSKVPALLTTKVLDLVRRAAENQERVGLITDEQRISLVGQAQSATLALADIFQTAYALRVTSDYEPETLIEFGDGTFRLMDRTDLEAHAWIASVTHHKSRLLYVARELGIVT